jgi:ABC-type transporter Mla MlaB component
MERPSFFQTSMSSDVGGRADTLKKIDEIEAQMSRQWWKAKSQDTQPPSGSGAIQQPSPVTNIPTDANLPPYSANPDHSAFASTRPLIEPSTRGQDSEDFASTMMAGSPQSVPAIDLAGDEHKADSTIGFSASRLFSFDADEMATDPELEEAAIRFANGDDAGAEAGLLAALRGNVVVPLAAQSWVVSLLDLYRATGNGHAFAKTVTEFSLYLDGTNPVWVSLGGADTEADPVTTQAARLFAGPTWESPGQLKASDVQAMRAAMMSQAEPWVLSWSLLQDIAPDAMPMLSTLFGNLCQEPVKLRFSGAETLARALRASTPSGNRSVDRSWWNVRLNALRAMGMQDDFELAALDYCITFEAAPPEWAPAACSIALSGLEEGAAPEHDAGIRTSPIALVGDAGAPSLVLRGEILGDASEALAALDEDNEAGSRLAVDCEKLIRVDFAAAGSILNWVAQREVDGKLVQFQNVHRLVAAFFNVIGINEHAKVIPRAI